MGFEKMHSSGELVLCSVTASKLFNTFGCLGYGDQTPVVLSFEVIDLVVLSDAAHGYSAIFVVRYPSFRLWGERCRYRLAKKWAVRSRLLCGLDLGKIGEAGVRISFIEKRMYSGIFFLQFASVGSKHPNADHPIPHPPTPPLTPLIPPIKLAMA